MSVRIIESVHPSPRSILLPGETTLEQVLQADGDAEEKLIIEYRLSASHNVWFLTPGDMPVKTLTFQETISDLPTPLHHRVRLDQTHESPELGSVQIDEIITEPNGKKRMDLCIVGLL